MCFFLTKLKAVIHWCADVTDGNARKITTLALPRERVWCTLIDMRTLEKFIKPGAVPLRTLHPECYVKAMVTKNLIQTTVHTAVMRTCVTLSIR